MNLVPSLLVGSNGIELILPETEDCFNIFARNTACAQVIANLLDNAIYWLTIPSWQEKEKTIRISCDIEKRVLIVEDTGPGVHSSVLAGLFQPFVSKKTEGQGLGLYICDFYLRQMRAKISYKPRRIGKYRGARFVLDFSKVPEE